MANAIGMRGYVITVRKKGNRSVLALDDAGLSQSAPMFVSDFIARNATPVQSSERERSHFFEEVDEDGAGNSKGYIHYGTFGFESNLVNSKTKKRNYRRKRDDVEEIPLFYEFWLPSGERFMLALFQSFAGRSCINWVTERLQEEFSRKNKGYSLNFTKLLPSASTGGTYATAPVKKLRLVKRAASSDVTDRYLGPEGPESANIEVTLTARRNSSLGMLRNLKKSLGSDGSAIALHDGISFSEATAEVLVGGRRRKVGVFGKDADAGVIDVTDEIENGTDGHPTYKSLAQHSDEILKDFRNTLSKSKL